MAAILCNGIFQGCNSVCHCTGSVCSSICSIPCKVCDACCVGISDGLCKNPFGCFFLLSVVVNGLSVGLSVSGILDCRSSRSGSSSSKSTLWWSVTILLSLVHILVAVYISYHMNPNHNTQQQQEQQQEQQPTSFFSKATYLLCYDKYIAMYIIILLVYILWLFIGLSWAGTSDCNAQKMYTVVGIGFLYLFLGGTALLFSLGCAMVCDKCHFLFSSTSTTTHPQPFSSNHHHYTQQPQPQQTPDVETPTQQPQGYHHTQPQPQQQPQPQPVYPTNSNHIHPNDYPKYAQAYTATATADEEDNPPPMAHAQPIHTTDPQPPAAYPTDHPANRTTESPSSQLSTAGKLGSVVGKKVGTLLTNKNTNDATVQRLESQGAQAGETIHKGYTTTKKFIQSQLEKKK